MTAKLRSRVRKRARNRCEYCLIPLAHDALPGQIDHIIATQHDGSSQYGNLAMACGHCNLHKGPNIAGIDRATKALVALFNPRKDRWRLHFRYEGAYLMALTPVGRVTLRLLQINHGRKVRLREELMKADL